MTLSVDLDGVLNFYPANWLDFLRDEFGYQFKDITEVKQNLTYAQYKEFKRLFRASPFETEAPNRTILIQALNVLTQNGSELFVHTSRAVYRADYFDKTHKWLKTTGLNFSKLAFKSEQSFLSNGVSVHIDDDIDFLYEASGFSDKVKLFLFSSSFNQNFETVDESSFFNKIMKICE